jgi:hypothetical protein
MKRADATRRLRDMLERVSVGGRLRAGSRGCGGRLLRVGALTVGDVDLFVQHQVDERLSELRVRAMFEQRNPDLPYARASGAR